MSVRVGINRSTRTGPSLLYMGSGLTEFRRTTSPLRRPDSGDVSPTIYAASTMRGAIMETVLHDVPVPASRYIHDIERDLVSNLHMSSIEVQELRLINLTSAGLRTAGLKHSELFDGNKQDYPRTREWAAWFWAHYPDAQGLIWISKQDN